MPDPVFIRAETGEGKRLPEGRSFSGYKWGHKVGLFRWATFSDGGNWFVHYVDAVVQRNWPIGRLDREKDRPSFRPSGCGPVEDAAKLRNISTSNGASCVPKRKIPIDPLALNLTSPSAKPNGGGRSRRKACRSTEYWNPWTNNVGPCGLASTRMFGFAPEGQGEPTPSGLKDRPICRRWNRLFYFFKQQTNLKYLQQKQVKTINQYL